MATNEAAAAHKEAFDYWGYMVKPDKCGTENFDRLLSGIATHITTHFEPSDSPDITPSQLAAFYKAVGGDYDVLFVDTDASSLAFIYRSLGCFHSLQPAPNDDGYSSPTIPALKKKGFITWQTIQLLLGPEEHVPFLQNAVSTFDIIDPSTGTVFPKILPKDCFPSKPDEAMEQWYDNVAQKLQKDAEEDDKTEPTRVRVEVDEPTTSSETSEGSADERTGAAHYFSDPLFRKTKSRPTFSERFTSKVSRSPRRYVEDRSKLVANSVRHMWNPFGSNRRRTMPGRYETESESDHDATPIAVAPGYSSKRPHTRREEPPSSAESESDSDGPSRHRRRDGLRSRRSREPVVVSPPREYFPKYTEDPLRYAAHGVDLRTPDPLSSTYGPSKAPLFATHVAQLQPQNYYERRPAMPARASYQPQNVRYKEASPRGTYDYGERRRRRSEEYPPRDRVAGERPSRSHDRNRRRDEDWDEGSRSRDRHRDRDRDRDRDFERERERDVERSRTHRYVKPVDGVGGRRYPVEGWQ